MFFSSRSNRLSSMCLCITGIKKWREDFSAYIKDDCVDFGFLLSHLDSPLRDPPSRSRDENEMEHSPEVGVEKTEKWHRHREYDRKKNDWSKIYAPKRRWPHRKSTVSGSYDTILVNQQKSARW